MSYNLKAVLVDDEADSRFVNGVVNTAKSLGLEIRPISDPNQLPDAIAETQADALIVDMKLQQPARARQVAREAAHLRPDIVIFFWTEFGGDADYGDLETSLSPLIRCDKGLKTGDTSPEVLERVLVQPIEKLTERTLPRLFVGHVDPVDKDLRPFELSVDEISRLPLREARLMVRLAAQQADDLVEHIFGNSDAEWLLVAGPQLDVIRWGATLANMPNTRRITELGRTFGYYPYLFTRPVEVDNIDSKVDLTGGAGQSGRVGWIECPPGDYYPSIGLDFIAANVRREVTQTHQIHFDTGASRTFLSMELMDSCGALDDVVPADIRSGNRGGERYEWIDRETHLLLSDGYSSKRVQVRAVIVFDWFESPFARLCTHGSCPGSKRNRQYGYFCGRREAGLLGRDVIDGKLRVVFDGLGHVTRFLSDDEQQRLREFRRNDGWTTGR